MKRTIRLRESELKRMIAESVRRVLRESDLDLSNETSDVNKVINKNGIEVEIGKYYEFMTLNGTTEKLQVIGFITNPSGKVDGVKTKNKWETSSRWLDWIVREC